jgi:hypothetical protein
MGTDCNSEGRDAIPYRYRTKRTVGRRDASVDHKTRSITHRYLFVNENKATASLKATERNGKEWFK